MTNKCRYLLDHPRSFNNRLSSKRLKFVSTFSDLHWRMSVTSCARAMWRHLRLTNKRAVQLTHLLWPGYKICNQNLACMYSKRCLKSLERERNGNGIYVLLADLIRSQHTLYWPSLCIASSKLRYHWTLYPQTLSPCHLWPPSHNKCPKVVRYVLKLSARLFFKYFF